MTGATGLCGGSAGRAVGSGVSRTRVCLPPLAAAHTRGGGVTDREQLSQLDEGELVGPNCGKEVGQFPTQLCAVFDRRYMTVRHRKLSLSVM